MINLKFYSFKERQPFHQQEILFINKRHIYESDGYGITSETIELQWVDYDCGDCYCYNGEDSVEHCSLCVLVNGFDMTDSEDCFWMSTDSYWDAICKE